jgi:hypothetical protein
VPGRIAHLSLAALRLAASHAPTDADAVAHWLYRFGTVPRGPALDRDFGPDDDPMAVLGMTVGGRARRVLETAYAATSLTGWYSFARALDRGQLAAVCKLYVSPRPEALADAFPRIVDALVAAEVRSFKVGRGIEGLLRPDKIIAYFEDHTHMAAVTAALDRSLSGCPPQGVPFTAESAGDGLLSTGVDPPATNTPTSWRAWVTKRLAVSLTDARALPREGAVAATLADMRRQGIDPERWQPAAGAFNGGSPA